MNNEIAKFTMGPFTAKIYQDEDPCNPREWDNLGTMVCFHNRYNLGDVEKPGSPEGYLQELLWNITEKDEVYDNDDIDSLLTELEKTHIFLPLFLYDHSGITINTRGFSCPWDSGQVGWIYVTKKDALEWFNRKRMTKKLYEKIVKYLEEEVKEYDMYLTGDVYGYSIEGPDDYEDSCWGFFGYNSVKQEVTTLLRNAFDKYNKSLLIPFENVTLKEVS